MKKFYIETFGCSRNLADSEVIAGALSTENEQVFSEDEADFVVVNTCTVKTPTENKVLNRLKKLSGKKLIVAGCMPVVQLETLKKVVPNAEFWGVKHEEVLDGPRIRTNRVVGVIPIAEGCLGACSYCIVRFARGKLKSYSQDKILKAIRDSVKDGCKEVWITSQDNSAYGFDSNTNLAELLGKVSGLEGNFALRVGMMNPKNALKFLPELVESFKHKKVFKFLHLPVQSGNNRILQKMNRGYSVEDFEEIVSKFREEFPELTLATDIIVGFPSESEKEFQNSIDLIERVQPDIVNISRFGARPGTESEKMEQIPDYVKKERSRKLTALVKKIGLEKNKEWMDWKGKVLIDEKGKTGSFIGRNFAYKPIVVKSGKDLVGQEIEVKVEKATESYLIAQYSGPSSKAGL